MSCVAYDKFELFVNYIKRHFVYDRFFSNKRESIIYDIIEMLYSFERK